MMLMWPSLGGCGYCVFCFLVYVLVGVVQERLSSAVAASEDVPSVVELW